MTINTFVFAAVASHYERKAERAERSGRGTTATLYRLWAGKAREGRSNPLVLRVQRLFDRHAPLSRSRARILADQSASPLNPPLDALMTPAESAAVRAAWKKAPGNWSIASVINACANVGPVKSLVEEARR